MNQNSPMQLLMSVLWAVFRLAGEKLNKNKYIPQQQSSLFLALYLEKMHFDWYIRQAALAGPYIHVLFSTLKKVATSLLWMEKTNVCVISSFAKICTVQVSK